MLLLVILFVVITSIVCAAVAMRRKRHTTRGINKYAISNGIFVNADVIDHVPVDDNPAYITLMKKITLNKNSAYETVTVASHYETV